MSGQAAPAPSDKVSAGRKVIGCIVLLMIALFVAMMNIVLPGRHGPADSRSPGERRSGDSVRNVQLGHLGYLRTRIQTFRDKQGLFPSSLQNLTSDGADIQGLPALWSKPDNLGAIGSDRFLPHDLSSDVVYVSSAIFRDSGHWAYVNEPSSPDFGTVFIDCTHTDSKGTQWTAY